MRIVCGTDLSEPSTPAATAAAAVATRMKATELWLVHALDPASAALDASSVETLTVAVQRRLEEEAARLRDRTPVPVHTAVLHDVPSDALEQFAAEKKASLLVVSSRGHAREPRIGVGSTSERVARQARFPVLVVRDPVPFEAWARGEQPLRILLGVDATASSRPAIEWAKELRRAGPCDVIVGHVYYADEAARRYGISRRFSLVEVDPEVERLIVRDLREAVGELPGSGQVSFRPSLGLGRLGDHLLALGESEKVDLMVIGTHRKKGLERLTSVSSIVLHYGHASVACIPTSSAAVVPAREIPKFDRVLVPTDLSPFSNQAVAYGYGLVADSGGEVYLLHVVPPRRGEPQDDADLVAQLRALTPRTEGAAQIGTRTEIVRSDDTARAICETAERVGADVICLASHGRSGIARVALGSVADEVMRNTQRPVLVIRPLPP